MKKYKKPIVKLPPDFLGVFVVLIYVIMTIAVMITPFGADPTRTDRLPISDEDRLIYAGILVILLVRHYEIYEDHLEHRWFFITLKSTPFSQISNGMLFRNKIGDQKQLRQQVVYLAKNPFRFDHIPKSWDQQQYLKKHKRKMIEIMLPIGREQEVIEILERCIGESIMIAN